MTEFGHVAAAGPGFRIDAWGVGPFVITVGQKVYRFEDSDRWGPHLLGKRGDLLLNSVPGERSPFWPHYYKWLKQGRQLAADGETCVYDQPKPGVYRKDSRGRRFIVEQNDADLGAGWVEAI